MRGSENATLVSVPEVTQDLQNHNFIKKKKLTYLERQIWTMYDIDT